jgi:CRP-like cAMP-binding protein
MKARIAEIKPIHPFDFLNMRVGYFAARKLSILQGFWHSGNMPNSTSPIKKLRPGQALFQESEMPRSLFLVIKGTLSIRKMKGAAYVEIARVYANEVVGELSFFDRQPRSASAFALTEVEVTEIGFDVLDKIFQNTPPYLKSIIAAMSDRLRKADDTIKRLQKSTLDLGNPVAAVQDDDEFDAASALATVDLAEKHQTDPGSEDPGSEST